MRDHDGGERAPLHEQHADDVEQVEGEEDAAALCDDQEVDELPHGVVVLLARRPRGHVERQVGEDDRQVGENSRGDHEESPRALEQMGRGGGGNHEQRRQHDAHDEKGLSTARDDRVGARGGDIEGGELEEAQLDARQLVRGHVLRVLELGALRIAFGAEETIRDRRQLEDLPQQLLVHLDRDDLGIVEQGLHRSLLTGSSAGRAGRAGLGICLVDRRRRELGRRRLAGRRAL
mmetsp:Transcript_41981/g.122874  ORF Transcript_41981/g.122874 Transcript_41981/m.122874 type:complete len:233 (-) Transcript_41981:101-799(-)